MGRAAVHGRGQRAERTENTLFSVGLTCVLFVSKSGSRPCSRLPAGLSGGLQQRRAARASSLLNRGTAPPREFVTGGFNLSAFVNTWQDEVIVCLSFKI